MGIELEKGFRLGPWVVTPRTGHIEKQGQTVRLEPRVMEVLVVLAGQPGELVERDYLLDRVWVGRAVSDEPLTQCIALLRRALDDNPKDPQFVQTVPKRGYRLIAEVSPLRDPESQTTGDGGRGRFFTRRRGVGLAITAAIGVGFGYLAYDQFISNPVDIEPGERLEEVTESTTRNRPEKSIAVLPFVNLSAEAEQEYFSDGLAEEILVALTRIPGLAVTSRTSSFAYKGDNRSLRKIAQELNVNYVLEGSVRKASDRVRISAKLIDATSDLPLWSNTFDRELDDIFAIQDETARAIGQALRFQLADINGKSISISGTENIEAYDAFLRGRFFLHQRGWQVGRAIEFLKYSTELDSGFAEAFAMLAIAKTVGHGEVDIVGADAAIEKALVIDPSLPIVLMAQGNVARRQFDFEVAEGAFREALALEPRNAETQHFLAYHLFNVGELDEAYMLGKQAVAADPTTTIYRIWLASYSMALGSFDEGLGHFAATRALSPTSGDIEVGWKAVLGRREDALRSVQYFVEKGVFSEYHASFYLALIHAVEGQLDTVRKHLDGKKLGAVFDNGAISIPYLALGDIREADRIMEGVVEEGSSLSLLKAYAQHVPELAWDRTRFDELRSRIGLSGMDEP